MKKEKTTIHDIAKKLNITASTVSRALNDNPRISDATKRAVQKAAQKLNYHPNQIAAALRNGRSNVIGVIVPTVDRSFFSFNTRLNCLDQAKEGVILLVAFPISVLQGAIKGNGIGHDDCKWQGKWPHIGWRIADCVSTIVVGELLLLAKTVQCLAAGILHPQIALKQGSQEFNEGESVDDSLDIG